ncbi:MAG: arsenate reductase (azurin) small subunit [Nitrospira sp.]|nr:MAG: arsenate reductase (azurin) small subunit [Nitrospira sp.]
MNAEKLTTIAEDLACFSEKPCVTRRQTLLAGAAALATVVIPLPELTVNGAQAAMKISRYPRVKIGTVSSLSVDKPVKFFYPQKHENQRNILVKLGKAARNGVGPEKDIVAFNTLCQHQGGDLQDLYNGKWKILGPCPFHMSAFDLTLNGQNFAASAPATLPQIELEVEGDDIYATGVMGIIYGFADNLQKI